MVNESGAKLLDFGLAKLETELAPDARRSLRIVIESAAFSWTTNSGRHHQSGGGLQNLIAVRRSNVISGTLASSQWPRAPVFPMPIREGRLSTRARTAAAGAP